MMQLEREERGCEQDGVLGVRADLVANRTECGSRDCVGWRAGGVVWGASVYFDPGKE